MKRASHIVLTEQDFREAIICAAKGHNKRDEVRQAMADIDAETRRFYAAYLDGTWRQMLAYRKLTKTNNNGKVRKIDSPSWETRVLQWAAINKLRPIYDSKDNHNGLNCKEQILPIEDAIIENQCGYIFADSTNQIKYFDQ